MPLFVLQDEINIFEPDAGDNSTVTACFSADISLPITSDAIFDFSISPISTADEFNDYIILGGPFFFSPSLVIPSGFNGSFFTCIDALILGDNELEGIEVAVFEVQPRSPRDLVIFPLGSTLRITIFDG